MADSRSRKKNTRSTASRSRQSGKKQQEQLRKKRIKTAKEILYVLLIGFSILLLTACFSPALKWLRNASYTLFGLRMYLAPFLIVFIAWFLLFREKSMAILKKGAAVLLILFSTGGILSTALEKEDGGLLGRAGYFLFHNLLGNAGSYIIYAVIAVIGLILLTDFSFSDFAAEKQPEKGSDREKLLKEQKDLVSEKREIKRTLHQEYKNTRIREENDELRRKVREEQRKQQNRDRFQPIYGIGDTTIRADDFTPLETTFYDREPAVKKNRRLFDEERAVKKAAETAPVKPAEEKPKKQKLPEIILPKNYFDEDENAADIPFDLETPKKTASRKPQESTRKTVETANGKKISIETDDVLKGKTVYNAENPPEHTEFDYSPDRDTELGIRNRAGSAPGADSAVPGTVSEAAPAAAAAAAASAVTGKNTPVGKEEAEAEIRKTAEAIPEKEYEFPPLRLLKRGSGSQISKADLEKELQDTAEKLRETLMTFGVGVTITNISCGPTVTRYEIQPEVGVKVSRIVSLTDDIKLNLAAKDIRMEAPIPGKSAIGIEIPNREKQSIVLRDLLESEEFTSAKSKLVFAAGRDIEGNAIIANIAKMPHVLVAGATGSGKSVCINTMIMSILYHAKPTEVKLILVDPKVVELSVYNGIPHLLLPVVTDPKKAASALNWAVAEMENRYLSFAKYGVRGIEGFNDLVERENPEENGEAVKKMPQILIIVDELADLMMAAPGDVETAICRLAQKARAAGIHLVLATQRPSVDVITGLIKANIPSRIAFAVSSGVDSRTILDSNGAEKLLGAGDMLYAPAGSNKAVRVQGAYVSDEEISKVVDFVSGQGPVKGGQTGKAIDLNSVSSAASGSGGSGVPDRDEFFADAGRLVIDKERASIGMLQRAFKLGFNRAARIVDQLAEAGVVGEEEGTKPRRVLMTAAQFEDYLNGTGA